MYGMRTLAKNLREQYEGAVRQRGLDEGDKEFRLNLHKLRKKHGAKNKFDHQLSLKALAEGILGENWQHRMKLGAASLQRGALLESVAAMDTSAFSNITGQLLIDRIRDNYDAPTFIGDKLFEIAPVTGGNLGQHREPWLSRVKNDPGLLNPGQSYPFTSFEEQYIDLPPVEKRGEIVALTMEMIMADKTKQAMDRCDDVGFRVRFQREERQLKVVAGLTNNFKYMGTAYNTYNTSGLWVNKIANNVITNYQGVTQLELLFSNMVDFVTGKSIMIDTNGMMILTVPAKMPELKIALHGARTRSGQYPQSGSATNAVVDYDGVPLINDVDYPMVKSPILWHLLVDSTAVGGQGIDPTNAKEYVFMGHFQKAFVYREALPFTTIQAPPGNPEEFFRDIAVMVKAQEYGVAAVQGPQQVVWSYNL